MPFRIPKRYMAAAGVTAAAATCLAAPGVAFGPLATSTGPSTTTAPYVQPAADGVQIQSL